MSRIASQHRCRPTHRVRQKVTFQPSIATGLYPARRKSVSVRLTVLIGDGWSNSTQIVPGSGPSRNNDPKTSNSAPSMSSLRRST